LIPASFRPGPIPSCAASYADALRERLDESLELSVRDALTGLFNRRYVLSRLRQAMDHARADAEPVTIALIDIDHFKRINDTWGHSAGDQVLREVCSRMGRELRAIDLAGRYGGEEFLVVFANSAARDAHEAMERVRRAVSEEPVTLTATGEQVHVTLSAGIAQAGRDDTVDSLIQNADAALYDAKGAGRNQVVSANRKAA
jgi:two-component system cell cycle response regulator